MARIREEQMALARVYARAILALAEEAGETDSLLEELRQLAAYLEEQPELAGFLASPLVAEGDRGEVLERLFRGRVSDLLADTLGVMNRKGRLGLLAAVAEAFRREVRDLRGETDVHVVTAVPLGEEMRRRLAEVVARRTGRTPHLVERVDPDLLGGLVVRVDDDKFDASVARELEVLGDRLAARASEEILSRKSYFTDSDGGPRT